MNKRSFLAGLSVLLFAVSALADPGDTLWTRFFGGGDLDIASAVIQTADGGYLIAGATRSFGSGEYDGYLIKTYPDGETEWEYPYGGVYNDGLSSVQQMANGDFVAAGFTYTDTINMDIYFLRVDPMGTVVWEYRYGGAGSDSACHIELTPDQRFVITGWSNSYRESRDVYVIRIDGDGDGAWTYYSGGIADDGAYCVKPTADTSYIIAGYTGDYTGPDIYIEKVSKTGGNIWYQGYHQGIESRAYSIAADGANSYVVAGYVYDSQSFLDAYLMKIDSNGGIVWSRSYGDNRWEIANCVAPAPDSGFILAGYKMVNLWPDTTLVYLVRVNSSGGVMWQNTIYLGTLGEAKCVTSTSDNNYVIAGGCNQYDPMNYNIFLAKIQGEYVLGSDDKPSMPAEFELSPAYPNPFNTAVTISYYLPSPGIVKLEIFDILGNRITCLVDGEVDSGNHSVIWNAAAQSSGAYFAYLSNGNRAKAAKIVLLK